MANLGNSIINGRLRVINETNTGALTVNGNSVSLLSGNIKDNTSSTDIVSAKQVADYITAVKGSYAASGSAGTGSNSGATVTIPFTPTATITTAGWLDKGSKTGGVVNGTYTMPSGAYSASGTAGTGSMSGRVVTIPFTPTATITTAGYLATGSKNGTVVNGTYTVAAGAYSASGTAGTGSISGNVVTIPFTPKATVGTAGYVSTGSKDGTVVNGTYTITTGTVTQPTATQTGATVSLSGTTITLSKSVTPNVTTAGIISTGTAGTVTLQGTVPTESKTATTSGDITPTTGKLLSKVNVPSASPKFTGGAVTGGAVTGGDLSITTNYSGTPTVTVSNGSDTNMTNITVGSKAQSGYPYYFKVSGASSALSGKTKATRAAVARAAVKRAAVKYNGAVDGWVEVNSGATALIKDDAAIAANNAVIASTSVEPTVTVNAGSGSTYVGIKAAVITNGFITGAGYIPDDDTAAYKTQYNATDDCVDILFN